MPVQVLRARSAETTMFRAGGGGRVLVALDQVEQRLPLGTVLSDRCGEQAFALVGEAQEEDAAVGRRRLPLEEVCLLGPLHELRDRALREGQSFDEVAD